MILFPALKKEHPLICYLVERPIAKSNYEALSYVWGDPSENTVMYCSHLPSGGHQTLTITKNLEKALRALRRRRQFRILWVDAVCINQQNTSEKERQIPLMADIYSNARRTLIWLGEEGPMTRSLFHTYRCCYLIDKMSAKAGSVLLWGGLFSIGK